ncbi:DUF218 domain protein [Aspergillus piperis CBS 112811]|uniref:DUF218 domain protein n=1 Tax=Aspergillus piperis CBS 112811 TaxID=1448313 RepID=A0A8G1VIS8_9EURO|nr:DUF218 domain protein [Aspergillus piperis CBS 112811]RAH53960.1 DUF218 domain protein [Aspergillus piperis CBS 112811]
MSSPAINPDDINLLAQFLAHEQIPASSHPPINTDCIVICVSAVLYPAEAVFKHLERNPQSTKTLVLCGGIGHSTPHLYEAVSRHPDYAHLVPEITGKPESHVLHTIFTRCFDATFIQKSGCTVLLEDKSTNCGQNALETRALLARNGIPEPKSMIVVQDPTMTRRTVASFEKAYAPSPPNLLSWPIIVPRVKVEEGELVYDDDGSMPGVTGTLWSMSRFLGLVLGEIPRLRDDEHGYGPMGKGFIGHVDIPKEVEHAYNRVQRGIGEDLAKR